MEALRQAGAGSVDVTVVIGDDAQLHELNRQFLGVDAPTDVLSFPSDEADPDTGERYLGDVLISLPRAAAQADARGHAVRDELQLLVVHGVLHLLGHDHAGPDEKARMWQLQASVLEMLDIHIKP
jgi:probable rRNA maturation factor